MISGIFAREVKDIAALPVLKGQPLPFDPLLLHLEGFSHLQPADSRLLAQYKGLSTLTNPDARRVLFKETREVAKQIHRLAGCTSLGQDIPDRPRILFSGEDQSVAVVVSAFQTNTELGYISPANERCWRLGRSCDPPEFVVTKNPVILEVRSPREDDIVIYPGSTYDDNEIGYSQFKDDDAAQQEVPIVGTVCSFLYSDQAFHELWDMFKKEPYAPSPFRSYFQNQIETYTGQIANIRPENTRIDFNYGSDTIASLTVGDNVIVCLFMLKDGRIVEMNLELTMPGH